MNSLSIIGNLTKEPVLRTTPSGVTVCNFTVAVNRRKKGDQQPDVDYFNVSAWNKLAETCNKYLSKGKKVCVVGPVSVRTYEGNDGQTRAQLEVTANDIEFLSARNEGGDSAPAQTYTPAQQPSDEQAGFTPVDMDTNDLPF